MQFALLPVAASAHEIDEKNISREISATAARLSDVGIETIPTRTDATDPSTAKDLLEDGPGDDIDAIAVLVLTGGTEQTIVGSLADVSPPVVLLGSSRHNSFAAAVEARSALERAGKSVELVYAENIDESTAAELTSTLSVEAAVSDLEEFRLGLIGEQSPWLVSAVEDGSRLESSLGPRLVQVDMETVLEKIEAVPDSRGREVAESLETSVEMVEPDEADLVEAARVYLGLKRIAAEYDLDAITVGCFELLPEIGNTACLALARSIDDGLVAGCEGDVQATMSMELLHRLTEGPVWMANTVAPDAEENELTFAHCTIATDMLAGPPTFRSHFESGTGVAIQGELEEREVTLVRVGGEAFDELFVATGTVTDGVVGREDMCRTQARIEVDSPVDAYLENTLGNHVAIAYGDVAEELAAVAERLDLDLVAE